MIFLISYSVTSYSLLTTKQQVIWNTTIDNQSSKYFSIYQDGVDLWNRTIIRNFFEWGIWKVYGQVDLLDYSDVDNNKLKGIIDFYEFIREKHTSVP